MKEKQIIGISQLVELPDHSKKSIPAKVDTGADSSSIWATSIHETNGELSFVLFAPRSDYYTGEVIKTNKYFVTKVKNSFGAEEFRFKVSLRVRIAGRLCKMNFNLANRANNRFPILIGRRSLKSKFIVDASITAGEILPVHADKPIVILKSIINDKMNKLTTELERTIKTEIIASDYKKLIYEINEYGIPKISLPDGRDIANSKVVYFKSHNKFAEHASAVAAYLKYRHVHFFDKEVGNFVSRSKLSEIFQLATHGIAVPKTLVINGLANLPNYDKMQEMFGDSFVIKEINADRGNDNYLITNKAAFSDAIDRFDNKGVFLVQSYIENDGFTRVLLTGSEVTQIVRRTKATHKDPLKAHLNKPHGGINASELSAEDFSSEALSLARKAAMVMGRSVAGVDLIQDKTTQKWYVLEVNNNPEIIGGINNSKKIEGLALLLERRDI